MKERFTPDIFCTLSFYCLLGNWEYVFFFFYIAKALAKKKTLIITYLG